MHLICADCSVSYEGRGKTNISRGVRLIVIKGDNSVQIHQDKDIKPLNYMSHSKRLDFVTIDGVRHLIVEAKSETIDVTIYDVIFEQHLDVEDEETLERYGTEKQIQEWLESSGFDLMFHGDVDFVMREYQTGRGPVDVFGYDRHDGQACLIEVKRVAKKSDVFQLIRYRSALLEHADDSEGSFVTTARPDALRVECSRVQDPHMYLVATRFRPNVRAECEKFGIVALKVPKEFRDACV